MKTMARRHMSWLLSEVNMSMPTVFHSRDWLARSGPQSADRTHLRMVVAAAGLAVGHNPSTINPALIIRHQPIGLLDKLVGGPGAVLRDDAGLLRPLARLDRRLAPDQLCVSGEEPERVAAEVLD